MAEAPNTPDQASRDEGVLESFGYQPELKRTLRPWAVLGIAFSFMSITTSVYTSFGFGLGKFGTASIWFWPVVLLGQLLVAFVLAELGSRIPLAGYSYQWGARLISAGYGWVIAAVAFAYLLTCAATITYVLVAPFVGAIFGLTLTPLQTLLIAVGALVVVAVVNIVGVRLFARINGVAVVAEVVAALFIALAVLVAVFAKDGHHVTSLTNTGGVHGGMVWGGIMGALAMGLFSLTGFEAAADMSEEAVGAAGSVPRAVIGSLAGSGIVGFIALICFSLATPNIGAIAGSSSPVFDIIQHWFGGTTARILMLFPLMAVLGTALAVVGVQGRLLFALARDNIAPGSTLLRRVNGHTKTPAAAIVVGTVLSAGMLVYAYFQSSAFTVLVGATSILPYVVYLMLIIAYAVRRAALAGLHRAGTFTLGRWAVPVFAVSFAWLVFALLVLTVPSDFHSADKVVGGVLVLAIAWYGLVLKRRISRGTAGVERLPDQPVRAGTPLEPSVPLAGLAGVQPMAIDD
jgi:amino acid transporter